MRPRSVEKGWGGPFGAVIVKDGEIIGRGQNRVLLTGCPVFHAEVTAIMDASGKLNPKGLLGSDYGAGTILEMIPREPDSPDLVPERARMLKGCEIYINGAPCPMCMSAIYWSRIDRVYFGNSLKDTSAIGFDDAFQYEDFAKPWEERRIAVTPGFEREHASGPTPRGRTSRTATPTEGAGSRRGAGPARSSSRVPVPVVLVAGRGVLTERPEPAGQSTMWPGKAKSGPPPNA